MSIELTTAEQALLNRIGATLSPPVVTELPETDADKAGELFYLNGTLWTYSKAGQFGTLEEGTPWPVKGYKEWTGIVDTTDGSVSDVQSDIEVAFSSTPSGAVSDSLNFAIRGVQMTLETSADELPIPTVFSINLLVDRVGILSVDSSFEKVASRYNAAFRLYPPTT